jgi:uncharacterized membrane protein (UPF0182 family)
MRASGRAIVITLGALFLFVIIFGRGLARFYVDMLWYDGLGQSGVFWGAIRARVLLFTMFFVLFAAMAAGNLAIADKLAPSRFPLNAHPVVQRFHETFGRRLRVYRYVLAGVFAFLTAVPTTTQWQSWLLFRHSQSFGEPDPQFHADIGFYVFELPFLSFVLDWLFFAMILVLLLVVMTHVLNGGVMFASPIPTISQAARGHVAVLLAVLAALKAADYWIRRYETTNERRGFVQGATYAVVNALHPALLLLAFVAIVTAGLYLASLRTGSWRLPLVASAVWIVLAIVAGYIYPAAVQGLVVNANQRAREDEYIQRNILATRQAMGITDEHVTPQTVAFEALSEDSIEGDVGPLQNVRLLEPTQMRDRFRLDVEDSQAGLTINDLDVDRYPVDEVDEQMLIAARELNLDTIGNRGWQSRHLINTRGCGLVMAPASRVEPNGQPDYETVPLDRPELYFSPTLEGYAIAGTTETERTCGDGTPYSGTAGVEMSSLLRRAAFGLAFLDYNIVGSGAIDDESQMLWVRNIHDRLEKLAPFLSYDGDPYPVAIDGQVWWVTDAYTSTARYPYAEAVGGDVQLSESSGIPRDANYVRNSVKAVVNAYDGTVTLYVMEDVSGPDPIIAAWQEAFPDLFTSSADMPPELRSHLRYPEDLFRVQTSVYSKYQPQYENDPQGFLSREGAWSVAQAPAEEATDLATATETESQPQDDGGAPAEFADESATDRFVPYYTMFNTASGREFVLLRPFVPFSTNDELTELQAFMTASSDPETYGRLTVYEVEGTVRGPLSVAAEIGSAPDVAATITQQVAGDRSAEVSFGDLQLVPIGDGLLYVRPFYVARGQSAQRAVPRYEFITVWYNNDAAIGSTLGEALRELFPQLDLDIGERGGPGAVPEVSVDEGDSPATTDPGESPDDGGPSDDQSPITGTPTELLEEADRLLAEADEALRDGDLGTYQNLVDQAGTLIDLALSQLEGEVTDTTAAAAPGAESTVTTVTEPPATTEPATTSPATTDGST